MTKEEFDNKPSPADELTKTEKDDKLSEEVDDKPSPADELTKTEKDDKLSEEVDDNYQFGWSRYSEITNGRFAMIGFLAIILIELLSQQSFLKWAGIL
ncbi:high light inducible protein [Prochlorococcus marinus CUG1415]|nr:chlorophyll a/b-binding protein [Prochlorococcus marinus]MBO8203627.1 high light inducible protein [Prochlorococcus marinus CUG1415]MBW3044784.1 high light inducible protein [Prochlorococcus marinus str. MU1415]